MVTRMPPRAVAAAGLGSLALFVFLAQQVMGGHVFGWDRVILDGLRNASPGGQMLVSRSVVVAPLVAAVAVVLLLRRRRFAAAFYWIGAVGGVILLDPVLKSVIGRPPLNPADTGYSFPSGSAMVSAAALIALAVTLPRARRTLPLVGGGLLVAAQGVILASNRWHYPSDVVGGWSAAIVWLVVMWVCIAALARRYRHVGATDRLTGLQAAPARLRRPADQQD